MLKWWAKDKEAEVPARPSLDLAAIRLEENAILFKHSRTCPVSWAAQSEVQRFSALHPEVPVYTLVVQADRELSRQVAEWTGVRHESPQVFVLRRGTVLASESHEGVNVEFLTSAVRS